MGLTLGKSLNRNYNIRLPLLDGYYNIGIFYNTKSPFLLFSIDPDFSQSRETRHSAKITMFKNIESSVFCETFLNLHNYRSQSLDIVNQFKEVKGEYTDDVVFILNEDIILAKVQTQDSTYYDQLTIYGFTLSFFQNDFAFILTERQNIISKLKKKVVRTSAIQIATTPALEIIDSYRKEQKESKQIYNDMTIPKEGVIKLE